MDVRVLKAHHPGGMLLALKKHVLKPYANHSGATYIALDVRVLDPNVNRSGYQNLRRAPTGPGSIALDKHVVSLIGVQRADRWASVSLGCFATAPTRPLTGNA